LEFFISSGKSSAERCYLVKAAVGSPFLNQPIDAIEIGQLFGEHAASLELYASQWTCAAEDCVQEAFIELASQSNRPEFPIAWLYRVVRNRSLNASRSERRRVNHERLAAILNRTHWMQDDPSLDEASLKTALNSISTEDRELIVLRIWSELTWQQIADLTGTSSSGAHRNYVAALKKMKQLMELSCPKNSRFRTI
jgi:RNA polymerase sigma-70 factor (ECF subfamily)